MAALPTQTRRVPRFPARCAASVVFGAGRWEGETEDLGALGCRFVSRLALRPGEAVQLQLRYAGVPFPLDVAATVAWSTSRAPWQTGVAFAKGQEAAARRFVEAVKTFLPRAAPDDQPPGFRSLAPPVPASRAPRAAPAPRPPPPPPQGIGHRARLSQAEALVGVARAELDAGRPARALPWLLEAEKVAPEHPGVALLRKALGLPPR